MIRLSYTAWFTAAISVVAFIGSATIAINVAHAQYPTWAAWPGWMVGLVPMAGLVALAHDLRHAQRETNSRIQQIGR